MSLAGKPGALPGCYSFWRHVKLNCHQEGAIHG